MTLSPEQQKRLEEIRASQDPRTEQKSVGYIGRYEQIQDLLAMVDQLRREIDGDSSFNPGLKGHLAMQAQRIQELSETLRLARDYADSHCVLDVPLIRAHTPICKRLTEVLSGSDQESAKP